MSTEPVRSTTSSYSPPTYIAEGRLRLRSRQLLRGSAARLRRAAARVGGENGLAMACVLLDMISAERSPLGWPVSQLIALLDGEPARRDRQVLGLLTILRQMEADIDLVASPRPFEAEGKREVVAG